MNMKHTTIAIIGAGSVGTTTAYALLLNDLPVDILLVDLDEKRCQGEIHDLEDAIGFGCSHRSIKGASFKQASNADIIIICAGARQKPGQSRRELLAINSHIIETIITSMQPLKSTAIILMITNPLDVLVTKAQKVSQLPHHQVFGSGTLLDTQRMRLIVSQKLGIENNDINGYILGEHGDNQFASWDSTKIGTASLLDFPALNNAQQLSAIAQETRDKVYKIIACKGSTFFGIATAAAAICKAIIFDQKRVMPLSVYHQEFGVYCSIPVVVGVSGIQQYLPLNLSEEEKQAFKKAVDQIKELYATII